MVKGFVCAALLSLASGVKADCGVSYRTFSNTYQYPVREVIKETYVTPVVPVAVPVLVPAFQFQYVAPCAAPAVVTPTAAAVATPAALQPSQGVYGQAGVAPTGVGAGQVGAGASQIRELAKAILAEMSKQEDGDDGPPAVPGFSDAQPSGVQQTSQMNHVMVLQSRCAMCHTGASAKAGVQIFSAPGVLNPGVDKQRISRAIAEGRMPQDPQTKQPYRLSAEEDAMVRQWLSQ